MLQIKAGNKEYDDRRRHLPSIACGQRWAIDGRTAGKPADIPPTVIELADGSQYEVRHALAVRCAELMAGYMDGIVPDSAMLPE